ncbi:MAG: DotU family type IV/VI secretion system protein [Polyangiales bacterium]
MHAIDAAPRRVKRRQTPNEARLDRLDAPDRPLQDAVRPLLVELAYLRQRDTMPPADVVFDHARRSLNQLRAKLEELRLADHDVTDVYYALVAFVDEAMQADQGPLKDFWQAHLLQLELFGETRAGEGFFDRLLRLQSDRRLGVLRVYYLCLLFGFQGIYAHHGELERENLIESVRETLSIPIDEARPLAPFGPRPDEPATDQRRSRLLQWLAGVSAALAVVWYLGIAFSVDARARVLTSDVSRAADDVAAGVTSRRPR